MPTCTAEGRARRPICPAIPTRNALAQIVGDVRLSIENATINGNVYGGSQGVVAKGD